MMKLWRSFTLMQANLLDTPATTLALTDAHSESIHPCMQGPSGNTKVKAWAQIATQSEHPICSSSTSEDSTDNPSTLAHLFVASSCSSVELP